MAVIALAACDSASSAGTALPATSCPSEPVQAGKPVDGVTLSPAQIEDAHVIYRVSAGMRLPHRAAAIAIATSLQESSLVNKPYGTSDSLGLFQQRPSQGWGTPAQLMDPVFASTRFLQALITIPGWQGLPLTTIAQDVQASGYPAAYAKWESLANALVATFNETTSAPLVTAQRPPPAGQPGPRRASLCVPVLPPRPHR
jgi:hypothetical protein